MFNKAYKFRIYPNNTQKQLFEQTFGCSRFVFNQALAEQKFWDEYWKKSEVLYQEGFLPKNNWKSNFFSAVKAKNKLKEWKKAYSWLKNVDSISLQASIEDLGNAFDKYYKKQANYPKFKSKKNPVKSYTTKMVNKNIRIKNNKIKLPKVGWVKYAKSREIPDDAIIKRVTVRKNGSGKYFISILVQESIKELPKTTSKVGLDVGLNDFVVDSLGNKVNNERYFRSLEQKLIKEQRKLSRKVYGSNNWLKQKRKVAKVHEKIVNKRMDFQHKLSTYYIKNHDVIGIEDLSVRNMLKNKHLSKSIQDASWTEFMNMLEYKAKWFGKTIVKIGRNFPSSQLCSSCGEKNRKVKDLSIREWTCKNCSKTHDRDINAAINIKNEALKIISEKKIA